MLEPSRLGDVDEGRAGVGGFAKGGGLHPPPVESFPGKPVPEAVEKPDRDSAPFFLQREFTPGLPNA